MKYFTNFTIDKTTAKALKVRLQSDVSDIRDRCRYVTVWLPKSQVQIIKAEGGYQRMISVAAWLCKKNNLNGYSYPVR